MKKTFTIRSILVNKKTFVLLLVIFSFVFFVDKCSAKNDLYVSPNGNDKNNGTIDTPFQTIQHAINQSKPGDTIFVRKGNYFELLTIDNYGKNASGEWLTIQAYQNEVVTIDGSQRNNNNRAGFSIVNSQNIKIIGFEIRNITTSDPSFYPAGIYISGSTKNIQILNNEIHHIENTHPNGNAHGIIVYGNKEKAIKNILIKKNKLHDLKLGSSESLTLSGNVQNFVINWNTIYDNNNIGIDIAGYYGACEEEKCIDRARNGIIANNHIYRQTSKNNPSYNGDASASGIYIDGGYNIQISNNTISNNDFGISVSSENFEKNSSNIYISRNNIFQNTKAGLVVGGSTVKNGGSEIIIVVENHFSANDKINDGYKEITLQQNIKSLTLKNNTYAVCSYRNYINNVSKTPVFISVFGEKIRPYLSACKVKDPN